MERVVVLDSRDDIIGGTFGSRFMIGKLVNGDHFSIMGENHNPIKRGGNGLCGVHETLP